MIYKLAISIILGGAMGAAVRHLSRRLIENRVGDSTERVMHNHWFYTALWILAGALGCGIIALLISDLMSSIEYMLIYFVLISVSVIDNKIRRIPNELVLLLFVLKMTVVIISFNLSSLLPALLGLVAGFVLFLIPSQMGMGIGWGDIKLAAAAGFSLGLLGILQATLIMSVILAGYFIYLLVSKKGNMKTKVALGPSLSLGMMTTLLFPLAI